MKLLYSNILPLATSDNQVTVSDCFVAQATVSDRIEIAVGYISRVALEELDRLVEVHNIKSIRLTIGMYFIEGMPEATFRVALAINEKWLASGIGEIRIVRAFKYHGECTVFIKTINLFLPL